MTYITERCVFRLGEQGLELVEIAPGIDLERDILAQMDFRPVVSKDLRTMDDAIFRDEPMGLRDRMLAIPLERRLAYAADQNMFFINFERLAIRSQQDIDDVRREIDRKLGPLGKKVYGDRQLRQLLDPAGPRRCLDRDGQGRRRAATTGA